MLVLWGRWRKQTYTFIIYKLYKYKTIISIDNTYFSGMFIWLIFIFISWYLSHCHRYFEYYFLCYFTSSNKQYHYTLSILAEFNLMIEAWASLSNTVLIAFFENNSCGLNNSSMNLLLNIVLIMSFRTKKKK